MLHCVKNLGPYRLYHRVANLGVTVFQMFVSHASTSAYRKWGVQFYAYKRAFNFNSAYTICNIFFSPVTSLLRVCFSTILKRFFAVLAILEVLFHISNGA